MASTPALGSSVTVNGKEALGTGVLRFIGNTKFRPGLWAGIEFATAVGKNDGSVDGTRYFSCAPEHGVFVPADTVIVQVCVVAVAVVVVVGTHQPTRGAVLVWTVRHCVVRHWTVRHCVALCCTGCVALHLQLL
jgi:hypothetical protein